ncbi:hypothetical protein INP51_04540 [Blautia liquoris]|uniref:Cell division protein FtsL n=1 Tax=Blautia liquoris TaxID=2779518 RepID=A0A7M2RJP8_9FIRM|nr:hypothetical protein [Blautia liquoris]QOV20224.1 hypothetical protein INP51_04540 [Blautia liquoris]
MARRSNRRVDSRADRYVRDTYEDGSAVRRLSDLPLEEESVELPKRKVSKRTSRNRKRAMQMSRGYVLFLTAICTVMVALCVNFLQLKAQMTTQNETVMSLESKLSKLKADNDAYYNTVMASVNMDKVKEAALNRLGLQYADESQVRYYNIDQEGYVRQYSDVPDTK